MQFTRHTAEDGTVTVTVDQFDDEATYDLRILADADPRFVKVDWVGVRVTILETTYRITNVDNAGVATLTRETD